MFTEINMTVHMETFCSRMQSDFTVLRNVKPTATSRNNDIKGSGRSGTESVFKWDNTTACAVTAADGS